MNPILANIQSVQSLNNLYIWECMRVHISHNSCTSRVSQKRTTLTTNQTYATEQNFLSVSLLASSCKLALENWHILHVWQYERYKWQLSHFVTMMVFWYKTKFAQNDALLQFIHPIHRFKSSDWLKEGHMTWIIFDNVHVFNCLETNPCVLVFTISLTRARN